MFRRNFTLSFVSGYFLGCFLFSITSSQSLSSPENEKTDLRILKDQIVLLNKNILQNRIQSSSNRTQSSIFDIAEVSVSKKDNNVDQMFITTKTIQGKNSIFVEFANSKLNCYDEITNQLINPEVMLETHSTCMKKITELPRSCR